MQASRRERETDFVGYTKGAKDTPVAAGGDQAATVFFARPIRCMKVPASMVLQPFQERVSRDEHHAAITLLAARAADSAQ